MTIRTHTLSEMIFMIGLPAAGKSTWVSQYLDGFRQIDVDLIKTQHPSYNPKNPSITHHWSKHIADHQFYYAISQAVGLWVVDTTGSNLGKMLEWMQLGKSVGFRVGLVYIKCSVATALSRNRKRERIV